jgi:flavin reductase (DIM6/NTAB) family NADH-FMN oxidoreductase RutF
VSSKPPVIAFSAGSTDAGLKDTPKNILESEEFVWNLVTEDLIEEMDNTSSSLAHGESEFDFAEVDWTESAKVKPPRVADAAICFECELYDSISVYDNTVLLGDVVHIYVCDDVLKDGEIDARKINAVGRLGGPFYTAIDMMDFERQY